MPLALAVRGFGLSFVLGTAVLVCSAPTVSPAQTSDLHQAGASQPWSQAEVLQAADLAHELSAATKENAPNIVYVGFRTLFAGGHISSATFHGTASTEKGLAELKAWLEGLPRSANLVIYCGCCPFDRCPNITPAYKLLRELGFKNIRVLELPTSFAADWVEKGYAIQKGL
jgi:thiosulfate/3-mercaptopyruvate sulfurtransferase